MASDKIEMTVEEPITLDQAADEYMDNSYTSGDERLAFIAGAKWASQRVLTIDYKTVKSLTENIESESEVTFGGITRPQQQAQWISVTDRVPKVAEKVLLYIPRLDDPIIAGELRINDVIAYWSTQDYEFQILDVTHWQTLPKGPNND